MIVLGKKLESFTFLLHNFCAATGVFAYLIKDLTECTPTETKQSTRFHESIELNFQLGLRGDFEFIECHW